MMRAWRGKVRVARAHNRQALQSLTSYATTLREYLGTYDKLRNQTDSWISKVDTNGETFDGAYQFLNDATAARQSIKTSIRGLHAPTAALGAAQSQLSHVLDDAIQAISDAESGISAYQLSSHYTDYNQTPGWTQFEDASKNVAAEYGAARAKWEAQVAKRLKTVKNRALPLKPSI
jgi:hypothetical protein